MEITVKEEMNLMDIAAATTIWKDNIAIKNIGKMYRSEHSPIRAQMFSIMMKGIPSFVSVHFVRHSCTGQLHYVSSCREDRGFMGIANRNTPVNHLMVVNSQHILDISRKRLCKKSHKKTTMIWSIALSQLPQELQECCVPECVYRSGCNEFKSCGYYEACKMKREAYYATCKN